MPNLAEKSMDEIYFTSKGIDTELDSKLLGTTNIQGPYDKRQLGCLLRGIIQLVY